jgi:AraC-like DNA-binding protein
MAKPVPSPRDLWYTPLPKNGKHGGALVRLFRPAPFELGYLSWGRRHYGEPALAPRIHEGWHYFVVLAGAPTLVIDGRHVTTHPGMVNIGDPECAIGHDDEPGRACQMLTWIWRTPPMHSALRPEKGGCLRLTVNGVQLRRLQHLHSQCREAVADSNERSLLQLRSARILIDLCILEAYEHRQVPESGVRIDLAVQFLRMHPEKQQVIRELCEYLQISKASLYRLFLDQTGISPRAYSQKLRMGWARDQIVTAKKSVKSVAYALGYRYPPDFSRAFKNHFGLSATLATEPARPTERG